MQKLISLFAEALEIMNIKAKLNVFPAFRKWNRVFSTSHFRRLFNDDGAENLFVQMKLLSSRQPLHGPSLYNLKLKHK